MKTINQLYESMARREGDWKIEILIPITRIKEWWTKQKKKAKK